jgi:hypothetical protein
MLLEERAAEVVCPTCAAPRWQPCVNPRNGEEREPHMDRLARAAVLREAASQPALAAADE